MRLDAPLNDTEARRLEMAALDELPERLRYALKFAAAKHSAVEVLGLLCQGMTEEKAFNVILTTDAYMIRKKVDG